MLKFGEMKILIKIVATIVLLYAIIILLTYDLFLWLSSHSQASISILIKEILIPYFISVVSMVYCIVRIWLNHKCPSIYKNSINDSLPLMKAIRTLIKIVVIVLLSYAILILSISGLYSSLSLSPHSDTKVLIEKILIPYSISIVSMAYSIIRIWLNSTICRLLMNGIRG